MYVSVVDCLCLYAYRFETLSLLENFVNKEPESESESTSQYYSLQEAGVMSLPLQHSTSASRQRTKSGPLGLPSGVA